MRNLKIMDYIESIYYLLSVIRTCIRVSYLLASIRHQGIDSLISMTNRCSRPSCKYIRDVWTCLYAVSLTFMITTR